jgi:hypothetical protein
MSISRQKNYNQNHPKNYGKISFSESVLDAPTLRSKWKIPAAHPATRDAVDKINSPKMQAIFLFGVAIGHIFMISTNF